MTIAVYAGSFDPLTLGHEDIIHRASHIFEELIIAIGVNPSKKSLFELEEKTELIKKSLGPLISSRGVEVVSFSGLLVNYAAERGAAVMIRGLRAVTDFEYEMSIAHANTTQSKDIETMFFVTKPEYSFVSSSTVKELAKLGGNIRQYVSPVVEAALHKKFDGKSI